MNEYRVPELNVQNGVLKALSFLFEYIGEMGKDYIYAVTPLLEDALMDRDLVHRQTAASVVQHIALGLHVCDSSCQQKIRMDNFSEICRLSKKIFPIQTMSDIGIPMKKRGVEEDGGEPIVSKRSREIENYAP
eukprot:jgi/Picre1/28785/NNA_004182.t1